MKRLALPLFLLACDLPTAQGDRTNADPPTVTGDTPSGSQTTTDPATPAQPQDLPLPQPASQESALSVDPLQGVGGTMLWVVTPVASDGCLADGRCTATVGGVNADIVSDFSGILVVEVPPFQATSGAVCVTLDDVERCADGFEALDRPRVDTAEVRLCACRCVTSRQLWLTGAGIPNDVEVTLDGVIIPGGPTATTFVGDIPDDLPPGTKSLVVRAPSNSRCGTVSEPIQVVIE